jgi:hypothetical protein
LAGRQSRSHTQYSTYTECAWKYKLKYLDGKVEQPAVWLAGGSAFHAVSEQFDRLAWALGGATDADLRGHVMELWPTVIEHQLELLREREPDESQWRTAGRRTKALPNGEDAAWWRTNGATMVNSYVDWRVANDGLYEIATLPDGSPAVEFGGDLDDWSVPVRYYPDVMFRDKHTGALIVVDKKTGSRMPWSTVQLGEYKLWIWEMYEMTVHYGAFYDARKGQLGLPRLLSGWTGELVGEMYESLDRAVLTDSFPPTISDGCKICGYRKDCKFFQF